MAKKKTTAKKSATKKAAPAKKAAAKKSTKKKAAAKKAAKAEKAPKKKAAKKPKKGSTPTYEQIAAAAFEVYQYREAHGIPGDSTSDWHEAEARLRS